MNQENFKIDCQLLGCIYYVESKATNSFTFPFLPLSSSLVCLWLTLLSQIRDIQCITWNIHFIFFYFFGGGIYY